jgi:hypothetical protein
VAGTGGGASVRGRTGAVSACVGFRSYGRFCGAMRVPVRKGLWGKWLRPF